MEKSNLSDKIYLYKLNTKQESTKKLAAAIIRKKKTKTNCQIKYLLNICVLNPYKMFLIK